MAIADQLPKSARLIETIRHRGTVGGTPTVKDAHADIVTALEGERSGALVDAADGVLANYINAMDAAAARSLLRPILLEEADRIGSELTTVDDLLKPGKLGSIYDNWVAAGTHIKGRAIVYGSVSAGGANTGTGTLVRVTVDQNGFPLEGCASPKETAITATCVEDINSRSSRLNGAEVFEIKGSGAGANILDEQGTTARKQRITGSTGRESKVRNASFSTVSPKTNDAVITSLSGWTATTNISNFQTVSDDTYRPMLGETTARAIRMTAADTLTTEKAVTGISRDKAYLVQVAFKRENSADGTLTLTIGAVSVAVTLSAQSGWTILRIALDADSWAANWSQSSVKLSLAWSSRTTGELLLDDVIVSEMTTWDGVPYAVVGGDTAFLYGDTFTYTDSETGSICQRWINRGWPGYFLPSANDATQVTASGGRTLTFDAAGKTITASSGSFVTDGYRLGMTLTVAGTSSNNGSFTITVVTATVITVSESVTNEGPLSATTTLDAASSISDPTVS